MAKEYEVSFGGIMEIFWNYIIVKVAQLGVYTNSH